MSSNILLLNTNQNSNQLPPYVVFRADLNQTIDQLQSVLSRNWFDTVDVVYIQSSIQFGILYDSIPSDMTLGLVIGQIRQQPIYSQLGYKLRTSLSQPTDNFNEYKSKSQVYSSNDDEYSSSSSEDEFFIDEKLKHDLFGNTDDLFGSGGDY